jgi:DNA repair protein RadC
VWDRLFKGLKRPTAEDFPDAPPRPRPRVAERGSFDHGAAAHAASAATSTAADAALPFASTGPQGHRGRMRERLLDRGAEGIADYELLEMLLFLAFKKGDTKPLAKALINRFGSFAGVLSAPAEKLLAEPGIGSHSAAAIKLVEASAIRLARAELGDAPVLNNWDKLLDYLTVAMAHRTVEEFRVLYLDNRNRLIADEIASRGTVNHAQVYVREVVKRALETHATALILVHNHPSGEATPSRDDIEMTREIERAAAIMEIVVHDHLIIGKGRWTSLRREGFMAER